MATFVDSAAAVEVSKPETVEMEVAKVGDEEIDASAKGLKRKLEDAVPDEAVKTNGTAEEDKNGHAKAENGNGTNGNHVDVNQEVKDSPVKKAKTEETEVTTETVDDTKEKESSEESKEKVEEAKTEAAAETEVAAVVESTGDKDTTTEEAASTTTETASAETEPEKVAETAEAEAIAVDEKKDETEAVTTPAVDPVSTDPEEKATE